MNYIAELSGKKVTVMFPPPWVRITGVFTGYRATPVPTISIKRPNNTTVLCILSNVLAIHEVGEE